MTIKERKALYIADQCIAAGMTIAGAAGAIVNFDCESLISEINVEDRYHNDTGKTDEDYVWLVDNCPGYDFMSDNGRHYGFGIAQWTLAERKRDMKLYHDNRGVSIGDFRAQVDFFLYECRKDFAEVWSTLCSSDSPYQCAYTFCLIYENPANAQAQAVYRAGLAQGWYDFLVENLPKYDGEPIPAEAAGCPDTRPSDEPGSNGVAGAFAVLAEFLTTKEFQDAFLDFVKKKG